MFSFKDIDDNDPKITAPIKTLTISEDGNLNDLTGVTINDLDKDFENSKYKLELM